jgi:hypothetical protein
MCVCAYVCVCVCVCVCVASDNKHPCKIFFSTAEIKIKFLD